MDLNYQLLIYIESLSLTMSFLGHFCMGNEFKFKNNWSYDISIYLHVSYSHPI